MRSWGRIAGGAAAVALEADKPMYMPGQSTHSRLTITANSDIEAKAALVRLTGEEEVRFEVPVFDEKGEETGDKDDYKRVQAPDTEQRIPGPIKLSAGRQQVLEVQLHVPVTAPPTYSGPNATHRYQLSGALDVAWSTNPSDTTDIIAGLTGPGG